MGLTLFLAASPHRDPTFVPHSCPAPTVDDDDDVLATLKTVLSDSKSVFGRSLSDSGPVENGQKNEFLVAVANASGSSNLAPSIPNVPTPPSSPVDVLYSSGKDIGTRSPDDEEVADNDAAAKHPRTDEIDPDYLALVSENTHELSDSQPLGEDLWATNDDVEHEQATVEEQNETVRGLRADKEALQAEVSLQAGDLHEVKTLLEEALFDVRQVRKTEITSMESMLWELTKKTATSRKMAKGLDKVSKELGLKIAAKRLAYLNDFGSHE